MLHLQHPWNPEGAAGGFSWGPAWWSNQLRILTDPTDDDPGNDTDNSQDNSRAMAGEPLSNRLNRPIRSTRIVLPSHLNDFVTLEDEECYFWNFKNLDINHVRLNSMQIFNINNHKQ